MVLVQKWPILKLFLGNISQEDAFYDILEQEHAPLGYKNSKIKKFKSRKIAIFPKGLTHGFGPKMPIFPFFLFRQFRPEKRPLRYSTTKKRLSRL